MKILITGSNGFIGGNLKDFFLKKNYNTLTPKRDELNLLDKDLVKNYLINNKFDIVIHSAVTLESVDQNLDMYFNIEGSSKYFGKLLW